MRKRTVFILGGLVGVVVSAVAYVSYLRVTRPPSPPTNVTGVYPWGAMHVDADQDEVDSDLELTLRRSFRSESPGRFDPDENGVREYNILILSGGGSAGAFGAGFLTGWTASGKRPDFKVVTGVSTGSLQATFAFLGPDYDEPLTEVFTKYGTEHIYETRGVLEAILGDSAWDSAPLKELIDRYIDEKVLQAVAAKHDRGYRLFVGTSNMDTKEFVIWDMGEIAKSDTPGKLEHYRNVLLASCSIPVLFPPVYFGIEVDGETYYEMHMDGGAQSQTFMRGFMLDFEDALTDVGISDAKVETALYVIRNGVADEEPTRHNISPSLVLIATAMINGVFELSTGSSLYRIYVLANRYGVDFNMAALPDDLESDLDPVIFDVAQMNKIYDWAHEAARTGYDWRKFPPGLDPDEVFPATNGGKPVDAIGEKR